MKRTVLFTITLLMVASLLFANGQTESKKVELAATTGGMSASSPAGRGMAKFAEKVTEYSKGSMEVKVFYDTTLGNASSAVSGMQQGTVDLCVCGDSYYSGLAPEIQAFELPYMFSSYADARKGVSGPAGEYVAKKLIAKGIQPLTFWEIGFRNLTNSKHAVKTPADLKGIKLRCLPATFQVKAWEAAGAIPVPMDVSELYSSLQQGVVDGQENPLSEIYNQKFYEVQKFISLTEHVYTPMLFSASAQTWSRLTKEQQEIVMKAAKDAQAEVYKINDTENAALLDKIKAAGLQVEANPDKAAFKAAMATSRNLFAQQYGNGILDLLK